MTADQVSALLSKDTLVTVIVFVCAVFALLAAASSGIRAIRDLFPKARQEKEWQEKTEKRLANDFARLNDYDLRISRIESGQQQILLSVKAIMHHEITGNSVDRLKEREAELDAYLVEQARDWKGKNNSLIK